VLFYLGGGGSLVAALARDWLEAEELATLSGLELTRWGGTAAPTTTDTGNTVPQRANLTQTAYAHSRKRAQAQG